MIVYLAAGMNALHLRIKDTSGRQLTDWRQLQLLIDPGEHIRVGCGGGSPWYLTGCWPGKRTNVDVANPARPDFPTICIDAHELDPDGRVVFRLDQRVWCLTPGRYHGTVRVWPRGPKPWMPPFNVTHDLSREGLPKTVVVPPEFMSGTMDCPWRHPEPLPMPEPVECCVLMQFDIDIGPSCAEHVIDQIVITHNRVSCGDE
jgi:hypothetical protein